MDGIYNKVLLGKNKTQNELYDRIHLYKFRMTTIHALQEDIQIRRAYSRQARNGEKKEQIKKQMKQGKGLVWTEDSDMPRIRG